ncbi:MAG: SpoVA/SpoVAEb family sporulation membrane protein [Oscillospiraceae bacterium]|nr:SpoVA/SpoVAEb family sporulation membrane protein [Oscillospiraceae bacterium]
MVVKGYNIPYKNKLSALFSWFGIVSITLYRRKINIKKLMGPNLTVAEGYILGIGANMFKIAGPVIVYGTVARVVYGIIYWITTLF